jgi:hypothetical protein
VNAASLRALASESRTALASLQAASAPSHVGPLVVSGMLAEQLARELAAGARAGSVVLGDELALRGASVSVRVIAGDPSAEDLAFVEAADDLLVPVVLVQLWPQEEWSKPFVLTPFVVECRPGKGFPVDEIAARIAEASEDAPALAARMPALSHVVERSIVRSSVARAALLAGLARSPGSRGVLALEQVRMLSQLRVASVRPAPDPNPVVAAVAAGAIAFGYALRSLARAGGRGAPSPLVNAVVAGAGTWTLARVARELDARLPQA